MTIPNEEAAAEEEQKPQHAAADEAEAGGNYCQSMLRINLLLYQEHLEDA